jgi:MoxR-like ATPase
VLQQVEADTSSLVELLDRAHQVLAQHWLGDDFVIEVLLTSIIAKGHVLLVDVPGVGKTTLAKSMAQVLGLDFNRIQFTNDILPADILGGSIYSATDGKFSFAPGPIFTDFLLADEINRGARERLDNRAKRWQKLWRRFLQRANLPVNPA